MRKEQIALSLLVLAFAATQVLMPRLSRKGFYFGLTVPAGFAEGDLGRRIFRVYATAVGLAAALTLFIAAVEVKMSAVGLVLMIVVQAIALAWARRRVAPFRVAPLQRREASLATRTPALPGGWIAWVLPFVLPLAAMGLTNYFWETIPARVPVHYGIDGQADRWLPKSFWSANFMAVVSICTNLAVLVMAWQLAHARRISPSGEAAVSEAGRHQFMLRMMLGVTYLLSSICVVTTLQLLKLPPAIPPMTMVAVLVGAFILLAGLSWRKAQQRRELEPPLDGTPDECWHLGMFYANPRDPALLVEQRLGFGYSLNFGRPAAWAILALAVAPGVLMSFLK
jgi:uncharacterized membrane protein